MDDVVCGGHDSALVRGLGYKVEVVLLRLSDDSVYHQTWSRVRLVFHEDTRVDALRHDYVCQRHLIGLVELLNCSDHTANFVPAISTHTLQLTHPNQ